MILKLLGLFVIVTVIKSEKQEKDEKFVDYFTPAKYSYSYGVEDFKTGDYKMHKEERDGDVVKGEYIIADPDGSIRTVTYTADKEHGYKAVVKQSEPLKVSTELKENQALNTENNQSSEYVHQSLESSTQSYNLTFNDEGVLKHTPINFHKSINKDRAKDRDNLNKEEINQYLQYYQSYISKLKNNQQEIINYNAHKQPKELETVKDLFKKQNSNFQVDNKESVRVNPENSKEVTKMNQVGQNNNFDYSEFLNYKPNAMDQIQYTPEHIEISKQETSGGLYKNDVKVHQDYQPVFDNIPADLHGNYGQKLNVDKKSAKSNKKVDVKQATHSLFSTNEDYIVNGNKKYHKFYQPNIQNQYELKKVKIQNPKFYESTEKEKLQENLKVTENMKYDHLTKALLGKHNSYKQEEEKPAISYQTIINENKLQVSNDKYNQYYKTNEDGTSESLKKYEVPQFYYLPNKGEENIKKDKNEMTKNLAEYYGNIQKQEGYEIFKNNKQNTQPEENIEGYLNDKTIIQYLNNLQKPGSFEIDNNNEHRNRSKENIETYLNDDSVARYYAELQKQGEIEIMKTQNQGAQAKEAKENTDGYLNGETQVEYYVYPEKQSGIERANNKQLKDATKGNIEEYLKSKTSAEYYGNLQKQGNQIIENQSFQPKKQYQLSYTYSGNHDYKHYPIIQFDKKVMV